MSLLDRLYRTKLLVVCIAMLSAGVLSIAIGNAVNGSTTWRPLSFVPWQEFGGILIGGAILSVWLDRFFKREQDAVDEQRLRRLLREQAPAIRDAVLNAFAANTEDLRRVATPETLDGIITNSLALRLSDARFAAEVYRDIRDQAITAPERWHDAMLSVDLAPADGVRSLVGHRRPASFVVTARWEYTTIPQHVQRRFVCLSDREEYRQLSAERGPTTAWFMNPANGVDAGDEQSFRLTSFSVNGEARSVRRASRKHGQIYTANVGADVVEAGKPVTIAYTIETMTTRSGHLLYFNIDQPTRDLRVDFDYGKCELANVSVLDLIPSVRPTSIERPHAASQGGRTIHVDIDGWIFPRSGVGFVWTLASEALPTELKRSGPQHAAHV